MNSRHWLIIVALMLPVTAFAGSAGRAQFVAGDVKIESTAGVVRLLKKGESIEEGESIVTGRTGQAQLLMADEAIVAVRPNTRLKIEAYQYTGKPDAGDRGFFALLRGGFRSITGLIGHANRNAYRVKTPTATIGIRGTDHEPLYIPPPAPGETPIGPPGTYDKVNSGGTTIENASGRVDIGPNQAGFVPPSANVAPVRLPQIPSFMNGLLPVRSASNAQSTGREGARRAAGKQPTAKGANPPPPDGSAPPPPPPDGTLPPPDGSAPPPPPPDGTLPPPDGSAPPPPPPDGTLPPPDGSLPPPLPPPDGTLPPPPPPLAPPVQGTLDPSNPLPGSVPAPLGFAITGGDLSGNVVGSGAGVVGNGFGVELDASGNVISVGSPDFSYSSAGAPLAFQSNTTVNGIPVHWGIYAGGTVNDSMGVRYPTYFHYMGAPDATSATVLSSVLNSPMTFTTTAANNEYTKPITENGLLGGSVSLSITLGNTAVGSAVTAYSLNVSDANSRNWSAYLANGPVSLVDFLGGGTGSAQLSVVCSGCPITTGTGKAHGVAIGTTTVNGVISSYDLNAGGSSVTGSALSR